jgi:hypothetical protein
MQVKPLYRDPITGYLREAQSGDTLNTATLAVFNEYVTLFNDATELTCCAIVNYTAIPINSVNLPNNLLRNEPSVDCIILQSGLESETVLAGLTHGKKYQTSTNITYTTSDTLYLGRDGKITTTKPSLAAGDHWLVEVGRLVNHNEFIFDPQPPINLTINSGGYTGQIPDLAPSPDTWLYNDGAAISWKKLKASDIAADAAITSFTSAQTSFEVGQQINTPAFTASYNETVVSARLRDNQNFSWNLLSNFTSFNSTYNFKLNTVGSVTFTLEATLSTVLQSTLNLNWYYRKYYGTSTNLTLISDLGYNNLSSSKAASFTVNANTNEYIYYAIPTSFGTPIFYVGGFEGGFHLDSTVNFVNSFGITTNYSIYKSDNHSLGNTTITVL